MSIKLYALLITLFYLGRGDGNWPNGNGGGRMGLVVKEDIVFLVLLCMRYLLLMQLNIIFKKQGINQLKR